ncbi:MAG: c-type cytochrome [Planctomycetota bacterium]|nr:c-type cytochrome [Planctomycetota bacterium]
MTSRVGSRFREKPTRNDQLLSSCFIALAISASALATSTLPADRFTPAEPITAQELFGQTIRASSHRSPAEELSGFHVAEGFQVDLIAAEPAISKPMNMAFDVKGRLWITQSTQYPFPAKADESGSDAVVVLEDKDSNGSFETTRVFADGLNIPIGLLPYGDGVLCFSIPNILYLRDTDNDGLCDTREVVLGPFDTTRDTHGMVNSLRMGEDNWVYACHGFNNQSKVQGKDGQSISMTSGNVFRFKPDGSRVELFTQGQVNPFGMARDRWGFWYAADCHSKPISQLIRGGCYPSFGRPDDGLGFVPPMMDHLHGSTAISGLAHSKDSKFPTLFQDNFFSGNVMTCRINRNHLTYQGATAKANAMPDLMTSDDPWFRPVDLQFGPDGCLYVADFYNKVIGHYEVPLDHPDRDRKSGRIWRIRWTGGGETIEKQAAPKTIDDPKALFADRFVNGLDSVAALSSITRAVSAADLNEPLSAMQAYYLYSKLGANKEDEPSWLLRQIAREDSLSDPVLKQSILIATRDILTRLKQRDNAAYDQAIAKLCSNEVLELANKPVAFSMETTYVRALVRVLLSLKDARAAAGVLSLCEKQAAMSNATADQQRALEETIQSIADVVDESNMDRFMALLDSTTKDADARADQLLRIAGRQMQQRGRVLGSLLSRCQVMVGNLGGEWLKQAEASSKGSDGFQLIHWSANSTKKDERRNWPTEKRELARSSNSESKRGSFFSSFPLGESYIGTWASSPFIANGKLDFYVVGHNGLPSKESTTKNYVALVKLDVAGNVAEELFRAQPPRSDIGQQVEWDLAKHAGMTVQLRVVDGDADASYAWIGIGESSQSGLNPSPIRDQWDRIVSIVELCGVPSAADGLEKVSQLLGSKKMDWQSRYRLQRLRSKGGLPEIVELVDFAVDHNWLDLLDLLAIDVRKNPDWDWGVFGNEGLRKFGDALCRRCSYQEQERLVLKLSKHRSAIAVIASLCERGAMSRDALRVLPKSWWESLPADSLSQLEALRPEANASSDRLAVVERKVAAIERMDVDMQVGKKQFADRCAICHKLGDQGKVIGPQLEGVGARGAARLSEDILWPDRNVDEAFRMTLLLLESGESVSGLVSDRTVESLLLTDQTGKQRRILLSEIDQEKPSKLSLMPGNFDELMTDGEFASLIGFLRSSVSSAK